VEEYGVSYETLHGNVDQILYSPGALRVLKAGNPYSVLVGKNDSGEKARNSFANKKTEHKTFAGSDQASWIKGTYRKSDRNRKINK
jgi:hypothetical protein